MLLPPILFSSGLSRLADESNSRYTLAAVRLERDEHGPVAIVTDGCKLMAVRWTEMDANEFPGFDCRPVPGFATTIPTKRWDEVGKLPPKKSPKPIITNVAVNETTANGRVEMAATDLETVRKVETAVPEGRYPKWQDCFPRRAPEATVQIAVTAEHLSALMEVFSRGLAAAQGVVTLEVPLDPHGAIVARSRNDEGVDTIAILMPAAIEGYDHKEAREEATKKLDRKLAEIPGDERRTRFAAVIGAFAEIATPNQLNALADHL